MKKVKLITLLEKYDEVYEVLVKYDKELYELLQDGKFLQDDSGYGEKEIIDYVKKIQKIYRLLDLLENLEVELPAEIEKTFQEEGHLISE